MSEQAVGQEADVLEISRWFIYAEDGRGSAWAKNSHRKGAGVSFNQPPIV